METYFCILILLPECLMNFCFKNSTRSVEFSGILRVIFHLIYSVSSANNDSFTSYFLVGFLLCILLVTELL